MNIIFMGSAAFSVPSLEAIIKSSHHVVGVITNPEKPAGRGLKIRPTPVAELAGQHNIDIIAPVTLRNNSETAAWIRQHTPDAAVVVAYGKFIPPDVLHIPAHGCLNVHPSLLPKYRGAAPIQRALMNGEAKTGISVMLLDEGMDSGPVFMQSEMGIEPADDAVTLGERLSQAGADMLVKTLDLLEQKRIEPVAQQHVLATLAPKISKEEGRLDFNRSAMELHNIVRSLIEWPTAWTSCNGEVLQVLSTEPLDVKTNGQPGVIMSIDKQGIYTATGSGVLRMRSVRPSGGKAMDAFSYANGRRIKIGDVLG
jgi:methionyl-tRNA formyltransferase